MTETLKEGNRRRNAVWRERHREDLRAYHREYMRQRRAADPEKAKKDNRENARRRRAVNPEAIRTADRAFYHSLTPEQKRERAAKNRQNSQVSIRAAAERWRTLHADRVNARTAARRAQIHEAMPKWVNRRKLCEVYSESKRITMMTGIPHHVDHIVPLVSKVVCGLHVPWNLQVIPANENARKSNKLLPEAV